MVIENPLPDMVPKKPLPDMVSENPFPIMELENPLRDMGTENPLPDMVTENAAEEVCFPRMPQMAWAPSLSLFVMNRVCELVQTGVCFDKGFKQTDINRVGNDFLDLTRLTDSTTQIYNHLRKWRAKWVRISYLREHEGATWIEETSTIMMDEEKLIAHV